MFLYCGIPHYTVPYDNILRNNRPYYIKYQDPLFMWSFGSPKEALRNPVLGSRRPLPLRVLRRSQEKSEFLLLLSGRCRLFLGASRAPLLGTALDPATKSILVPGFAPPSG